jgi:predicted small lipoprotein YifL
MISMSKRMPQRTSLAIAAALLSGMVAACGQKGPLTAPPAAAPAAVPASAPAR